MTQHQSVSAFESEVRNSLSVLNPEAQIPATSTIQKKISPKIALHFKVLCERNATLPMF